MPSRRAIAHLIEPEKHDLGGFSVRRSLPHPSRTMVGPFIFFDHLGPAVFPPGEGVDVRPHPHINLATVTYLFEGSLLHRDSLGVVQEILPGAVNWMTAGKGVVHSERSPQAFRDSDATLHAIQTWIALPESAEEIAPNFSHHAAADLPTWKESREEQHGQAATTATLIAGSFGPFTSPVATFSPTLYLALEFTAGSHFSLPASPLERAIYSVTPGLQVNGEPLEQYRLALLQPDADVDISATDDARCMVVGGEPLGTRHKYWNFVSSRPERIEQAKRDWKEQRFPQVPGETECIPLPD
ncbi:MAG: pirin family protein [Cyanobacteria bacterium J06614_10]